jgi:hypothetical protein
MDPNAAGNVPYRLPPPKDVDPPRQRIDVAVTAPYLHPRLIRSVSALSQTQNKVLWLDRGPTEMFGLHQGRSPM